MYHDLLLQSNVKKIYIDIHLGPDKFDIYHVMN